MIKFRELFFGGLCLSQAWLTRGAPLLTFKAEKELLRQFQKPWKLISDMQPYIDPNRKITPLTMEGGGVQLEWSDYVLFGLTRRK